MVYCEAFRLLLSIALNALYVKIANTSMLNEHVCQSSEGLERRKELHAAGKPLTRNKFLFFLISGRKHSISCLVGLSHSSRFWCWLVYVNTAAAGVLLAHRTGDDLQGVPCCWGLCCASTGDQPLDVMGVHKKRRVKGDL